MTVVSALLEVSLLSTSFFIVRWRKLVGSTAAWNTASP
ncbi:hypothetical protein LINPERPRIM_LOCUS5237 [Linum perenne]